MPASSATVTISSSPTRIRRSTSRIALAPRASIDNLSMVIRKVLARGRVGIDLRGGGGYDNERRRTLSQAGASLLIAPTWSSRIGDQLRHVARDRDRPLGDVAHGVGDLSCGPLKIEPASGPLPVRTIALEAVGGGGAGAGRVGVAVARRRRDGDARAAPASDLARGRVDGGALRHPRSGRRPDRRMGAHHRRGAGAAACRRRQSKRASPRVPIWARCSAVMLIGWVASIHERRARELGDGARRAGGVLRVRRCRARGAARDGGGAARARGSPGDVADIPARRRHAARERRFIGGGAGGAGPGDGAPGRAPRVGRDRRRRAPDGGRVDGPVGSAAITADPIAPSPPRLRLRRPARALDLSDGTADDSDLAAPIMVGDEGRLVGLIVLRGVPQGGASAAALHDLTLIAAWSARALAARRFAGRCTPLPAPAPVSTTTMAPRLDGRSRRRTRRSLAILQASDGSAALPTLRVIMTSLPTSPIRDPTRLRRWRPR